MICVLEKILFKTPAAAAVTTAALFFAVKLGLLHTFDKKIKGKIKKFVVNL
jgi:hypothetical protein